MYTSHHPAWDAKSRVSLPEALNLDYKNIAHIFEAPTPKQLTEPPIPTAAAIDKLR